MQWNAKSLVHNGQNRIAVYFEKDEGAIKRIKLLTGVMWSVSLKAWHLPDTIENRKKFKIALEIKKNEDHIVKQEQFKLWLKSKRYSENTVKTYCDALNSFLLFYKEIKISEITNTHVIRYNNEYIIKNKLSSSFQNQVVNALKLFFTTIENKQIETAQIDRPRRESKLPNVLSKEEIKLILDAHSNTKHKMM